MKRLCAIACALLAVLFNAVSADVPELLSYQGVLTDGSGVVVGDGAYNVTLRLYTVEVGGAPIWEEAHLLTVSKGIFNARLGWTQPLGALDFDLPYYLGISVEGGAELEPRTLLTDAAYAMNARMVKGSAATANRVPAAGSVGIGTTSPAYPLTVRYDNAGISPAIAIENNYGMGSQNIIDFRFDGVSQASIRKSNGGNLFLDASLMGITLRAGAANRMVIQNNGRVGIGTDSPVEVLDVAGAVRMGTTAGTNAGTMRWTGSDFEGYDGSTWKSLTATGGGSLPPGTTGQTLWYNGSSWAATSSLYNNNAQIGIGTVDPEARLDIVGTDEQNIKVETSSATGRASVTLQSTGGDLDYLYLTKHAPSAGGTTAGSIPLANLSRVTTGTSAGPLMLQVVSANPMHFVTGNLERMRLTASGNLGINTTSPGAKLHVDGNQWDLTSTEGDFKIGDATHRLKFGVATGGAGAGTAGIRVAGGAQKLILGGGTAEVLSIDGAGNTSIGGPSSNAKLRLFRSGVDSALVHAYTLSTGGALDFYDEAHVRTAFIQPDANGEGGYLWVGRNVEGNSAFYVDGNYSGTGSARVYVGGASTSVQFRLDQTDNGVVSFPTNAIAASEVLDEPGAASYASSTLISLPGGSYSTLASRTIVAPAAGYVLAVASCQANIGHTSGDGDQFVNFGISTSSSSLPANQDVLWRIPSFAATGSYDIPVTVHGLFQVASGGSYTYYFLASPNTSGNFYGSEFQLTLLYIPTSYGTVQPTLAGAGQKDEDAVGRPLDEAAVAAERAESEAANAARIERELAEMRAENEAMKQAIDDLQRRMNGR